MWLTSLARSGSVGLRLAGILMALSVSACGHQAPGAVTAAATQDRCPVDLHPDARGVGGGAPGPSFVPAAATTLRACRYDHATDPPLRLGLAIQRTTPDIATFRRLIDQLAAAPTGSTSCGSDMGTFDLLIFRYAHAAPVVVSLETSGCENITNGRATLFGRGADELHRRLNTLFASTTASSIG